MSHYEDSSSSLWCNILFPVASWYLCIFGLFYTHPVFRSRKPQTSVQCHISVYNSSNSCTGTNSDTFLKSLLVCKQNSLHCFHRCCSFACSLSPQRCTQYLALLSSHKIVIGLKRYCKVQGCNEVVEEERKGSGDTE